MLLKIVSVRDSAIDAFGRPIFVASTGQAVRSFGDEVNNAQGEMAKHPADYELYLLGSFDDSSGAFDTADPVMLARAVDLVVK